MLTIAWDVDDVLNNLMQAWLEDYCLKNNQNIAYDDIIQNAPHMLLGLEMDKYLMSLDEFRMSEKALAMKPNSEILTWLEEYGQNFKHIALSATSHQTSRNGAFWVMKHFSRWIQSYNIVPSYRFDDKCLRHHQTKKEFLEWIKVVDILIDDSENNIESAKSIGIKSFLVARPWNKGGYTISEILNELSEL